MFPTSHSFLSFSWRNGYAVFPSGEVWGWGDNQFGDVGNGVMARSDTYGDFLIGTDVVPQAPEGNAIRAVRVGADVRLSYGGSSALLRRIYRDGGKLAIGTTPLPPDKAVTTFDDRGAVPAPGDYFYALRAVSLCSHTEGP